MESQDLLEAKKQILAESFSQARAYTNVIILAGYAGIFAIWNFTRDFLDPSVALSSALFLTLSVSGFVAWEIFAMIVRGRSMLGLSRAVNNPDRFEELLREHQENQHAVAIWLGRLWIVALVFTVTTALVPALLLITSFTSHVWNLYGAS